MRYKLQRLADNAADWLYWQAKQTAWNVRGQQIDFITKYTLIALIVLALITTVAQVWIRLIRPFM